MNQYIPTDETDAKLFLGVLVFQGLRHQGIKCSYDNDHKDGEVIVNLPGYNFVISTNDFRKEE